MTDQLSFGEAGLQEVVDFDEHAVIVPMPLILDQAVKGQGLAVYTVMKSFGRRAEASVAAYAERLGWDPETVKTWQKVLMDAGWMTLLREGENSLPRLWWMAKSKGERPPLGAMLRAPQQKTHPPKNTPPKQGLSKLPKSPSKTPAADAAPVKHPDQDAFWLQAKLIWAQQFPTAPPLEWPGPQSSAPIQGFNKRLAAALTQYGLELLLAMWKHCVTDQFTRPSLRVFFADPQKYTAPRAGGRGYSAVEDVRDFKG